MSAAGALTRSRAKSWAPMRAVAAAENAVRITARQPAQKSARPELTEAAVVIAGGREAGAKFVEGLTLHSHVANIGDVRSLAIHPASTTHSQLTEAEQRSTGVDPGLVRLSVGLESIDDIIADLEQGFAAAR